MGWSLNVTRELELMHHWAKQTERECTETAKEVHEKWAKWNHT